MEICIFMLGVSSIIMAFLEGTKTLAVIFGCITFVLAIFDFYRRNKNYEPLTKDTIMGVLLGVVSTATSIFFYFISL